MNNIFSYKKQREEIQKVMNEAMKLTEEPEPTAFLEKSRTMISKGLNLKNHFFLFFTIFISSLHRRGKMRRLIAKVCFVISLRNFTGILRRRFILLPYTEKNSQFLAWSRFLWTRVGQPNTKYFSLHLWFALEDNES